jgi:hypothetical protein
MQMVLSLALWANGGTLVTKYGNGTMLRSLTQSSNVWEMNSLGFLSMSGGGWAANPLTVSICMSRMLRRLLSPQNSAYLRQSL